MALKYALLGFLNLKPLSGYELKRSFDNSINHFWNAKQSQIYRELKHMEQNGLITSETIETDHGLNKKLYHLTNKGKKELKHWLKTPLDIEQDRIPFLIQIFFSAANTKQDVITLLNKRKEAHEQNIAQLENMKKQLHQQKKTVEYDEKNIDFADITLDLGIRSEHLILEWIDDTIQRVNAMDKDKQSGTKK